MARDFSNQNNNGGGMMNNTRTKSGIMPNYGGKTPFVVSCDEIAKYLNTAFGVAIEGYNKNARENSLPCINQRAQASVIPVTTISKSFHPLIILIPEDWVCRADAQKKDDYFIQFYETSDDDDHPTVLLEPCIREVLAKFLYSKEDAEDFTTQKWQRMHGVLARSAKQLPLMRVPRRYKFNDNRLANTKPVAISLIDPLRILKDMVTNPSGNEPDFIIANLSYEKISKKNAKFKFTKSYNVGDGGRPNNKKILAQGINNMLSGGGMFSNSANNDRNRNNNKRH